MSVKARDRAAVYNRDGHMCVLAQVEHRFAACWGPLTLQHTVGRGAGGSKLFDTPDLLVTMCNGHNTLATSDAKFARFCMGRGLVRSRNSTRDPRLVPVQYADGWFRLEDDQRVPLRDLEALEFMYLIGALSNELEEQS
jgi:hypothetical protein